MNEEFDEAPVNLSALNIDAERRAQRISARVSSRIESSRAEPGILTGLELALARWAVPVSLAAAASFAFVLLTRTRQEGEAFAALVLPRGPAAAWIASGRVPDVAEVTTMIGGRQ
jgi:hypothetical protein